MAVIITDKGSMSEAKNGAGKPAPAKAAEPKTENKKNPRKKNADTT